MTSIDEERFSSTRRVERERIYLLLLNEANKGLADVVAGNTKNARATLLALKNRRTRQG